MEYTISKNENIIKCFGDSQIDDKINFLGNVNFNYFVYSKNSEINLYFETKGDCIKGNVFVVLYGMGNCSGNVVTKIANSNCEINVLMLSLLQDDNSVSVNGNITVAPYVQNSQGHLLEKNLILGKNIKVKAIPRLDVYSQNVYATHGVSINKFDPESLFYMGNKGLDIVSSQKLLVEGNVQNILKSFVEISENDKQKIQSKILSAITISND